MIIYDIIPVVLMSLIVSLSSTFIASTAGIALGVLVALKSFKLKQILIRITDTLMSLPPVLMGLLVYLLLSRKGPFGDLQLLFTPIAMIIAQTLLILPIVFGLSAAYFSKNAPEIRKVCLSLGADERTVLVAVINESKSYILTVFTVAFGRAVSEVGAVMMVGGNIKGYTRVMTTYIALETGKGNFEGAIIIGMILLAISFLINYGIHKLQRD